MPAPDHPKPLRKLFHIYALRLEAQFLAGIINVHFQQLTTNNRDI